MSRIDLNLVPVIVALYDEKSVSIAAQRLGMSQPAVSAALSRLRSYFDDPLFIRTARGMAPTPRVEALIAPARAMLQKVDEEMLAPAPFDPATTTHCFTLALSDVGEIVFLPRILEALALRAPHASVRSITLPARQVDHGLESGEIDLAVGYFPDLKGRNFFQQRLFTHYFVCLLRASAHPAGGALTMDRFLELPHAVVRGEGRSQELFERTLELRGIVRKVMLYTPHCMSIPFILTRTDLVATVPHAVGIALSRMYPDILVLDPPMETPEFDLKQHWHRKFHADSQSRWLRAMVTELFNDGADEWRPTSPTSLSRSSARPRRLLSPGVRSAM